MVVGSGDLPPCAIVFDSGEGGGWTTVITSVDVLAVQKQTLGGGIPPSFRIITLHPEGQHRVLAVGKNNEGYLASLQVNKISKKLRTTSKRCKILFRNSFPL